MIQSHIMACSCRHDGQDKYHGNQMRVFNECRLPKGNKLTGYRCTVCGIKKEAREP